MIGEFNIELSLFSIIAKLTYIILLKLQLYFVGLDDALGASYNRFKVKKHIPPKMSDCIFKFNFLEPN